LVAFLTGKSLFIMADKARDNRNTRVGCWFYERLQAEAAAGEG